MNESLSPAQYQALLSCLAQLIRQLRAAEPADFGSIARRSSEPGEALVELLWRERAGVLSQFSALVAPPENDATALHRESMEWVKEWFSWAYAQNQFFELPPQANRALHDAHQSLLRGVLVRLHMSSSPGEFARFARLAWVRYAERLGRAFRSLVAPDGFRGRGAEYSAQLQLQILGLKDHVWLAPIVDLGCGIDANVVRQLRNQGLSATGLDRRGTSQYVLSADWFDVKFEPESLGTIISHLAFSLQFLHHHWHPGERAYDYARKYMELVRALVPGGLFCYAPGLPFIEDMLDPEQFELHTLALPEPLASTMSSYRDIGTGRSVAYACQVRRV